uniref:5' nucleotidase n=1 Tax=viral metagenome TaxID=1070528 RepID=A0A6M3J5L4_9ZZZZ
MVKIDTVFLDMDGVLVDFQEGIHRALDAEYSYEKYPHEKGKWDMTKEIIPRHSCQPASFKRVNSCCTEEFWQGLNWMHDGKDILASILGIFEQRQVYLLTTPMPHIGSWSGKRLWVEKYLPEFAKRLIITQAPKTLMARPNALLIDDKDQNVDEFIKAEGHAILIPRPWNRNYVCADDSVSALIQLFLTN